MELKYWKWAHARSAHSSVDAVDSLNDTKAKGEGERSCVDNNHATQPFLYKKTVLQFQNIYEILTLQHKLL